MTFLPQQPPTFPASGSIFVLSVSSGSVTQTSFMTAGYESILTAITASKPFTLKAEGDTWYRFSTSTSGDNIDELAITGSVQCDIIFAGERADGIIPSGINSLLTKGAIASKIRFSITG